MVHAKAARAVDAEPREVLAFCLDPESYQEIDQKIRKIRECRPLLGDNDFSLSLQANVLWILGPDVHLNVRIDRWKSITFHQTGGRLANRLFGISGQILVEALDEGTLVSRSYELETKGILRGPVEGLIAKWLRRHTEQELDTLAVLFNRGVVEMRPRRKKKR